jgi:hypothetical protein
MLRAASSKAKKGKRYEEGELKYKTKLNEKITMMRFFSCFILMNIFSHLSKLKKQALHFTFF